MGLPAGQQFGFVAQEVAQVIPELVAGAHISEVLDEEGAVLAVGMDVSGVNYVGLIPLLVAALQEQNATISTLQQQLTQLQSEVAGCCGGGMVPEGTTPGNARAGQEDGTILGDERALRIQPNPFNERTTLYYTLEKAGRMQLLANSADGKQLRVLSEAQREAGQYQYEWNTADLSPGVYYVTLLLDGEPVVEKAVKVKE